MLKLYHHGSSACAAKVRLALEEKAIPWRGHYIDILKGEQFNPDYLLINPKGVVPALVDGDEVITESTVICEYLEDKFIDSTSIYPASALEKSKVRLWTKAVDEELHPACSALTYVVSHRHTLLRNGVGDFETFLSSASPADVSARKLKWQWIQEGLNAPGATEKIHLYDSYLKKMEVALAKTKWLIGDEFSMADIAMAPYLNRLSALSMNNMWLDGRYPSVEDWFARIQRRPSFEPALVSWVPTELKQEMLKNGCETWPQIEKILGI